MKSAIYDSPTGRASRSFSKANYPYSALSLRVRISEGGVGISSSVGRFSAPFGIRYPQCASVAIITIPPMRDGFSSS